MEEVSSNIIIAVIINKYLVCHEVNKYKVGVKKSIQYGCFSPKLLEHKHFIIPFLYILSHFFSIMAMDGDGCLTGKINGSVMMTYGNQRKA